MHFERKAVIIYAGEVLASVFARLTIREILNRIVAKLMNVAVERYGVSVANRITKENLLSAVPPDIYSQLGENAQKVAVGYLLLPFSLILLLLAFWSNTVFGLGPPLFGMFQLGVGLIGLLAVYASWRSLSSGKRILRRLENEIVSYFEHGKLEQLGMKKGEEHLTGKPMRLDFCPSCGAGLLPMEKHCIKCGARLDSSTKQVTSSSSGLRPSCGAELLPRAKHCIKCGVAIKKEGSA